MSNDDRNANPINVLPNVAVGSCSGGVPFYSEPDFPHQEVERLRIENATLRAQLAKAEALLKPCPKCQRIPLYCQC